MNTMKTSSSSSSKKMRPRKGFMCQSPASTAICMSTGDPRSVVIIPRKTTADHGGGIDQHSLLLNKNNHHHSSSTTTSTTSSRYSSRLLADSHQHQPRQKINTTSTNLCSAHDHYHKKSSSAYIRDNRGGRVIPPPPPPPLLPALPSNFQVVVMRVSLHCQGCAGKVKKHLSKMEGVTSFSIDLEMKRVTVMGHVSPVGVLESISKVKRAEFWTSTTTC